MIYQIANELDFIRAFDRANHSEDFSVPARRALFSYYEEMSDRIGVDVMLDASRICCDWTEYTQYELIDWFGDQLSLSNTTQNCEEVANELAGELASIGLLLVVRHNGAPDTYLFRRG